MNKDALLVMCPPYPKFDEAPEDHSHSELRDCPKCKSKMWLSDKKKGMLMFASCTGKEIILGCYDCIKDMVQKDPSLLLESIRIDL